MAEESLATQQRRAMQQAREAEAKLGDKPGVGRGGVDLRFMGTRAQRAAYAADRPKTAPKTSTKKGVSALDPTPAQQARRRQTAGMSRASDPAGMAPKRQPKPAPKAAPKAATTKKAAPKTKPKAAPKTSAADKRAKAVVSGAKSANKMANEKFNKAKAGKTTKSAASKKAAPKKRSLPKGNAAKSRNLWLGN